MNSCPINKVSHIEVEMSLAIAVFFLITMNRLQNFTGILMLILKIHLNVADGRMFHYNVYVCVISLVSKLFG